MLLISRKKLLQYDICFEWNSPSSPIFLNIILTPHMDVSPHDELKPLPKIICSFQNVNPFDLLGWVGEGVERGYHVTPIDNNWKDSQI